MENRKTNIVVYMSCDKIDQSDRPKFAYMIDDGGVTMWVYKRGAAHLYTKEYAEETVKRLNKNKQDEEKTIQRYFTMTVKV